jgi:hypothetical protein
MINNKGILIFLMIAFLAIVMIVAIDSCSRTPNYSGNLVGTYIYPPKDTVKVLSIDNSIIDIILSDTISCTPLYISNLLIINGNSFNDSTTFAPNNLIVGKIIVSGTFNGNSLAFHAIAHDTVHRKIDTLNFTATKK